MPTYEPEHISEEIPRQAGFQFRPKLTHHEANPTQAARILKLLQSTDGWVDAPTLARISLQYSARVFELRRQGWRILNHVQTNSSGIKCGQFRLVKEYPAVPHSVRDGGQIFTKNQALTSQPALLNPEPLTWRDPEEG
jgi:hypothetical protein